MTTALAIIKDIYASMEHGNIGKLAVALDESILVYTADCLGGNRRGRDGVLQLVRAFYRPCTGIKKLADQFIAQGNLVIVLGTIQIAVPDAVVTSMPFADICNFENVSIKSVTFYYRDPVELDGYLKHHS
jgi:hypothetical protein